MERNKTDGEELEDCLWCGSPTFARQNNQGRALQSYVAIRSHLFVVPLCRSGNICGKALPSPKFKRRGALLLPLSGRAKISPKKRQSPLLISFPASTATEKLVCLHSGSMCVCAGIREGRGRGGGVSGVEKREERC